LEHIEARQQAVREAAEGGRLLDGADEARDPQAQAEAEEWFEDAFDEADIMAIEEAEAQDNLKLAKKGAMSGQSGRAFSPPVDVDM